MGYNYSENIYSTDSLSSFPEFATSEDLTVWGFKQKYKGSTDYGNPSYPNIIFREFKDTDNIRGRYKTSTLYRIIDSTPRELRQREA
jgi:hypothetical protein